jgi:hypothetical protein
VASIMVGSLYSCGSLKKPGKAQRNPLYSDSLQEGAVSPAEWESRCGDVDVEGSFPRKDGTAASKYVDGELI